MAIGLKTHIWNNAAKTVILLLGFPFLMLLVCYAVALVWVGITEDPDVMYGLRRASELLPFIALIAAAVSAAWFAIAFFAHQWMIDTVTGASKATRQSEPRLYNLVENLAIQRGLSVPAIRIIESPALNAYASGVRREHYAVTVTRGLLIELADAELEAVLAHEMTHIINGDVRLVVVAAVFAGVISLIGDVLTRGFGRSGSGFGGSGSSRSSSRDKGGGGIILILIAVVIFIVARFAAIALRLAISRRREYMADAGSVELTKNPDAMIGALRKIENRSNLGAIPGQVEALFIDSESAGFWATHPSIADRCAALVQYAGGRDPGPRAPEPQGPEKQHPAAVETPEHGESAEESNRSPGSTRPSYIPVSGSTSPAADGLWG